MKSTQFRRRFTVDHCNSKNKEDRISTLPDELLHHILSTVESNVAAQTCVLSKRWVNLWSTLHFLKFESIHFDVHGVYYRKFVTDFLFHRNRESDTTSIKIELSGFDELATRMIVEYAISHNVKHFIVSGGKLNFPLSFPVLTNLCLSLCQVPLMDWSLPSLTTLELEDVTFVGDKRQLSLEGFKKLKNLTLALSWELFRSADSFVIASSSVTNLAISIQHHIMIPIKFVVSTPNLSCFKFYDSNILPVFHSEDGFPCLKKAYFDIGIGKYEWKEYNVDEKNRVICKLISLFREFRGTKFLNLSMRSVQVLSRVTEFLVSQPSPFGNLKFLTILGCMLSRCNEIPIDSIKHVINFLLKNSPGTKVFIQDFRGNIKKYNPEEDTLLHKGRSGFCVANYMQDTAFNKQSTTGEVHGCGHCPIGPKQTTTLNNQGTSTDKVNGSFSLWEGHHIYSQYVDLLTQIKQNHPETFEHFTPQTEMIYTLGLNTLCSSVGALSRVPRTSFTASTITHYKGLFADLEKWGFNTTWLVNLLNKADEVIKCAEFQLTC